MYLSIEYFRFHIFYFKQADRIEVFQTVCYNDNDAGASYTNCVLFCFEVERSMPMLHLSWPQHHNCVLNID